LGITETNQNCIQEEIKDRLNSGNACNHSVHNFLSSLQELKNQNIKAIILSGVLYGCETWYLILMEEYRLRVFDNWVLRGIF
jgi:aspartate/glutamate racemase